MKIIIVIMSVLTGGSDVYYSSNYNNKFSDILNKHKFVMDYGSHYYEIYAYPKNDPNSWENMTSVLSELFWDVDNDEYDINIGSPSLLMETYQELTDNDEYVWEKKAFYNSLKKDSSLNTPIGILLHDDISHLQYCNIYKDDLLDMLHQNNIDNIFKIRDIAMNSTKYNIKFSSHDTYSDMHQQLINLNDWQNSVESSLSLLIDTEYSTNIIDTIKNRVENYILAYEDLIPADETFGETIMPDANEKIFNVVVTEWGGGNHKLYFETPNYYYHFHHMSD